MNVFQRVTIKTLKENKTRTIVTIIGILLSLSMFTAVTVSISSFRNFMLEIAIQREGNWHGTVAVNRGTMEDISSDTAVEKVSYLETIGYARLSDSVNPDKPYLFIGGLDENAGDILPLNLTEGRLPENDTELLIPEHLAYNGGISYNVGDTVTFHMGERLSPDEEGNMHALGQTTSYLYTEEELRAQGISPEALAERDTESFLPQFNRTYTIVGIYQRPSIEPYIAPGYTALTVSGNDSGIGSAGSDTTAGGIGSSGPDTAAGGIGSFQAYIRFHNPKDAIPWLEQHYPDCYETNSDLLRLYAASYESSYNAVLYRLAAVLIFIIMFGSISLIYNAFSISVTERTKQFGLLSSLGATRGQLVRSVLFEGLSLCAIGIPLGILAGIAGIGITFALLGASLSEVLYGARAVPLTLHVSPLSVAGAAALGLFTVLISAWIPARRAARLSPMEAIRQTTDIAIRPGKVRTLKLTYKLFGLSGMLASKNFKRNRRKYRATVLSLFVSVVLFISASSFCSYLTKAAGDIVSDSGCDIAYHYYPDEYTALSPDEILKSLSEAEHVTQAAWKQDQQLPVYFDEKDISREYLDFWAEAESEGLHRNSEGRPAVYTQFYFIDDAAYTDYLKAVGLSPAEYMNPKHPVAVASDFFRFYQSDTGKYVTFHLFSNAPVAGTSLIPEAPEGYSFNSWYEDEYGNYVFRYYKETNGEFEYIEQTEDLCETSPVSIGAIAPELPFFLGAADFNGLVLLYPASARDAVLGPGLAAHMKESYSTSFLFTTDDHKAAAAEISEALKGMGLNPSYVSDYAESAAQQRTLLVIITVFSYGFIILISLIAMANVFNTISTNIQLRKREFAMLKSTGMTPKGFRVMMYYECLLYGAKGLLYGLPVSIAITWWIYKGVAQGWDTSFYIPWYSLVIAIGSVFLVVGSTMMYSMQKIKKDNVVDALKNDNA